MKGNHDEAIRDAVRLAMRDRALYLLFIKREMEKTDIPNVEAILAKAIYSYGKYKSKGKEFKTPKAFINLISNPLSNLVMEGKVVEESEEEIILRENYCPLYQAWKEAGCSTEEIVRLCRIADWVDIGMIDSSPISVEFCGNMPEAGEYCQMKITKKINWRDR